MLAPTQIRRCADDGLKWKLKVATRSGVQQLLTFDYARFDALDALEDSSAQDMR